MDDSVLVKKYPRDEDLDEHTESIAILCESGANCFEEPVASVLESAFTETQGYGDSINASPNEDAIDYLRKSCPENGGSREEQVNAQKYLLSHSLWLLSHETILEEDLRLSLNMQIRLLPRQACVLSWVNPSKDQEAIKREIKSIYPDAVVATSPGELKQSVQSYLGWQVNPNGSAQTVIEWSHEAAEAIDVIG